MTNHAPISIDISELMKPQNSIIQQADGKITAIFNHGILVSYLVPPKAFDELLEIKANKEALA